MVNSVIVLALTLLGVCNAFPQPNDGRIVGGFEAPIEDFPYMANMYYNGRLSCSASILTENTILTAAHCTSGTSAFSLTINAGSVKQGEGVTHKVSKIIQHKNYESVSLTYDIALLILETPLQFSDKIQPIEFERSFVEGGQDGVSSGWGLTSYPGETSPVLLYLDVVTVDQQECKQLMYPYNILDHHLCADSGRVGQGVCRGDSGGPLAVKGKVVGIASWVKQYCAKGYPDVWARVSMYINWLDEHIV